MICEDYPRDAPAEERKFKSDIRDPVVLRKRGLTPEEKAKVRVFAGGEHWIKITFESAEAAEAAVDSSPQNILGYTVYAELYRGVPPTAPDEAIPAHREQRPGTPRAGRNVLPRSATTPDMRETGRSLFSLSPPDSQASSQTLDTATLSTTSTGTASTATIIGGPANTLSQSRAQQQVQGDFCRRIPTAKRIQLLPAEQALMPQKSWSQRVLSNIPLIGWLSSDIIGTTVPKTDQGEFDWAKASLYWKLIHWLDGITGWFDVARDDKED